MKIEYVNNKPMGVSTLMSVGENPVAMGSLFEGTNLLYVLGAAAVIWFYLIRPGQVKVR